MNKTENKFKEKLAEYGYELFSAKKYVKPEKLLTEMLEQKDTRVQEGFPVVFANALKKHSVLLWENENWKTKKNLSPELLVRLAFFMQVCLELYKEFELPVKYVERVENIMRNLHLNHAQYGRVKLALQKSKDLVVGRNSYSMDRLKRTFENYFDFQTEVKLSEQALHKKSELEFELVLSEFFTPRQKELLKKKKSGEKLTKTEREYYSRVLRKRLHALANSKLHDWAKHTVNTL